MNLKGREFLVCGLTEYKAGNFFFFSRVKSEHNELVYFLCVFGQMPDLLAICLSENNCSNPGASRVYQRKKVTFY